MSLSYETAHGGGVCFLLNPLRSPVESVFKLFFTDVQQQFQSSAATEVTHGKLLGGKNPDINIQFWHGLWHFSDSLHREETRNWNSVFMLVWSVKHVAWPSLWINTPVSAKWTKWQQQMGGSVKQDFTLDLLGHLSSPSPSPVHILHRQIMY